MPWWLTLILSYLVPYLCGIITPKALAWVAGLFGMAKTVDPDPVDQAALDVVNQHLQAALGQAIAKVGSDVAAQATPAQVAEDALAIAKTLIDPALIPGVEVFLKLGAGKFWDLIKAQFMGKAAQQMAAGKVLALNSPAQIAAFHSMDLAHQREFIAAQGKAPTVNVTTSSGPKV